MVFECFKCKIDENHAILFDTITSRGVEKVCRKCSLEVDTPIIKKVPSEKLRESQIKRSVYERLSNQAGLNPIEHRRRISEAKKINEDLANQDSSLREIVKKNVVQGSSTKKDERLIQNFHWIIMRKRRSMKISQEELAKTIGEPDISITSLEKGVLPRGYETIIKKLESYLSIRLFIQGGDERPLESSRVSIDRMRQEFERKIEETPKTVFDRKNPEQLTIGEMRELQNEIKFKPNPKVFGKPVERKLFVKGDEYDLGREKINIREEPEFIGEVEALKREVGKILDSEDKSHFVGKPPAEKEDKKDLTEDEITDLIFGRR